MHMVTKVCFIKLLLFILLFIVNIFSAIRIVWLLRTPLSLTIVKECTILQVSVKLLYASTEVVFLLPSEGYIDDYNFYHADECDDEYDEIDQMHANWQIAKGTVKCMLSL